MRVAPPARRRWPVRFLALTLALGLGACGSNTPAPTTPTTPTAPAAAVLVSITITGPARLALNAPTVALTATGRYNDGSSQDVTTRAIWASSTATVASVSAAGVLEPRAQGTSTVSAALGTVSGSLDITVTPRLVDVRGRVEEAYGGAPIPGAVVTVLDGPSVGRQATTDAAGGFVLGGLESSTFTVRATATDFEIDQIPIVNGTVAPIRLEPLSVSLRWQGLYATTPDELDERRMIVVRHAGPLHGHLHSDCVVGDSELGPLALDVYDRPITPDGYPIPGTGMLLTDAFTEVDRTTLIAPGTYYTRIYINRGEATSAGPSCGWRIEIDYPR